MIIAFFILNLHLCLIFIPFDQAVPFLEAAHQVSGLHPGVPVAYRTGNSGSIAIPALRDIDTADKIHWINPSRSADKTLLCRLVLPGTWDSETF